MTATTAMTAPPADSAAAPQAGQMPPRDLRPGESGPVPAREMELRAAIDNEPPTAGLYVELARLQEQRGAVKEAEQTLLAGRAALPSEAGLLRELAALYNRTASRLLQLQASGEIDSARRAQLVAEADRLRQAAAPKVPNRARQVQSGADGPPPPPPPPLPPPPPPPPAEPAIVNGQVAVRIGGSIKPPAKITNVPPVYPPDALAARVAGVVILEATIDGTGAVIDTRVLRSIPMLDDAATEAVRQWKFTPTRLNGVAVPVMLTVTVNFTLD